jgi:L-ascorbate metabolism protein UlaG (beta-lactamase superfamily)
MANLPDGLKITWLGHATFLVTTPGGKKVLFDPWTTQNPACPDDLKDPGDIDLILITHGHFDHIGDAVDLAKKYKPQVVCIVEVGAWLESKGVENVIGMNKGGTTEVEGLKVHMTHAIHSSGITDGDKTVYGGEAAGIVLELEDGFRLYHVGDTSVFLDMQLIGKLLKPDVTMLPIGDFYTMGPESAAEAIRLLGVKTVIPMHYGTFPALAGTPAQLREAASDVEGLEVLELEPGGSVGAA